MACDTELVALCVAEVGAVVVGVVLGSGTWFTLGCAAAGQSDGVRLIHRGSRRDQEGNHLTVAHFVLPPVERRANEKERSRFRMGLPASPRTVSLAEALLHTKHRHERSIERQSALEIFDTDEDVREQAWASMWVDDA
jgi:hypothetical protein